MPGDYLPESKNLEIKEKKVTRILVADDSLGVRESLEDALRSLGFIVESVENGQLLIDKLKTGEYDLVITDNNMPVMTGVQALQKIRETGKAIPVIVFSTDDIKDVVEKSGGVYCDKDPQNLLTTITELLENVK